MNMAALRVIDSDTVMYGVWGDPVRHSRSPIMLNRAFAAAGVNAAYAAFHIHPGTLREAAAGMRAFGFGGANVTLPHKVEVMEYLDEIDEGAKFIGAVNTIVNDGGRLIGYNTDGIGYVRSLKEETGVAIEGKKLLVIGSGGAARGVVYALSGERPGAIRIANRTVERAQALAADFAGYGRIEGIGLEDIKRYHEDTDIIINTTNVGMAPHESDVPIDTAWLRSGMLVSDIIYNPLKTALLQQAEARGCTIHGGLGMFIYQGAYAFEYWTGLRAPVQAMREAVLESLHASA